MVLDKSDLLPDIATGGLTTAGFRIPEHEIPIGLCKATGKPLTGTSANISGKNAATTAEEALCQFKGSSLDLIIDGGPSPSLEPSTIIHFEDDEVKLIREGVIPMAQIKKLIDTERG